MLSVHAINLDDSKKSWRSYWYNLKSWLSDLMPDKIRYSYYAVVPYDWRPGQIWYRVKCFVWHRYKVVNPKTLKRYTWVDRCVLLPHCMFQILTDFIEKECSPGVVDWEGSSHMVTVNGIERNVREEMQALYDWWHKKYLKAYVEIDRGLHDSIYRDCPSENVFIPLNDGSGCSLWDKSYRSEEEEKLSHLRYEILWDMEARVEEDLKEKMGRLVNIYRYLWT